ncbi:unnamed protein product [Caenorhabditis angaria]|uniref:Uncharacterized protein n=1 Tax=Caenorhabditis angaria TaxID=860376 RepID=A0A9P1ILE4_9PELO|nr:unnamed protein product [Caenorhabditis angaria]
MKYYDSSVDCMVMKSVDEEQQKTTPGAIRRIVAEFEGNGGILRRKDEGFKRPILPAPRSPLPPVPPPLHTKPPISPPAQFTRSASTSEVGLRRSAGPKPKLAPKPTHLNGLLPSTSTSAIPDLPPKILVSPVPSSMSQADEDDDSLEVFTAETGEEEENGIKNRAKMLEDLGFVPRSQQQLAINGNRSRPVSEVSDDFFDDGDTTASEDEDRISRISRRRSNIGEELALPRNERKNTACTTTHSEIMNELQELMNSQNKKPSKLRRQSNLDGREIPAEIGKLRDKKTGRHNSLFVGSSDLSDSHLSRITTNSSIMSDRSSTLTNTSGVGEVPDYYTGDEEEDKRLKKLHYAAMEFQKVQGNFVKYLTEMAYSYPDYMERFGKGIGKDLLQNDNVVLQIKKVLLQILPIHKNILDEINGVISNWNSETPNMANTINRYAEFLKCCQPFLDHKAEFTAQLLALRNENKDFDDATSLFETDIFKRGKKGAVIQQLDQVHQNFMRFKLLMLRYSEYLKDETEEKRIALETIEKLERVTQAVNQKMGLPTTEELTKLYYRFQCQFNVLEPGRTLIRQGDVMKQTRKEEQPRYLVLFTDCLWICRVGSTRGSHFEMNRSYRIPLEGIRVEQPDHEDYSRYLVIKSKVKSAVVIFGTEKERNQWMDDIQKATYDRKSYRRRQSEAIEKHEKNLRTLHKSRRSMIGIDEEEVERPCELGEERSRSTSRSGDSGGDGGFSSVPMTPAEVDDCQNSPSSSGMMTIGPPKKQTSEVKPVWLPDNISSECLMEKCSTEFSLINRRHHCRECGWLICKNCKGQAPLSKFDYKKQNVCPECFDKIDKLYRDGVLFPTSRLITMSDGRYLIRIGRKHESEAIEPQKLFKNPINYGFEKRNIDKKRELGTFGKIYLRNRKNAEVVRHALFRTKDLHLVLYKAELDSKPVFDLLIYGYSFCERYTDKNSWIFELRHRNQFKTNDSKEDVIRFRVDNSGSANKWSSAFKEHLMEEECVSDEN